MYTDNTRFLVDLIIEAFPYIDQKTLYHSDNQVWFRFIARHDFSIKENKLRYILGNNSIDLLNPDSDPVEWVKKMVRKWEGDYDINEDYRSMNRSDIGGISRDPLLKGEAMNEEERQRKRQELLEELARRFRESAATLRKVAQRVQKKQLPDRPVPEPRLPATFTYIEYIEFNAEEFKKFKNISKITDEDILEVDMDNLCELLLKEG